MRLAIFLFTSLLALTCFSTNKTPCRCLPNQPCWPSKQAWNTLSKQLKGKLIQPKSVLSACKRDPKSSACATELKNIKNPFYLQTTPAGSESQGWFKAWHYQNSTYAAEVTSAADVAAAVNFARKYNLRIAIKGAGHDYLGRNMAPHSLLIWTHKMRDITYDKSFIPTGCNTKKPGVKALTVGAGTRWLEAYTAATTKHGRYVQGGGCASVGAAGGFTQGGGFGSWSKKFGSGAGGMLQATVVTADGKVLVANRCQNQDIFWALRGGGGGTFGVVTKMTLLARPLPKTFGVLQGKITANSDTAYKELIAHFLGFFRDKLNNPHWGEQITFNKTNTITLFMMYQGLSKQQVQHVWQPLKNWLSQSPKKFAFKFTILPIPGRMMWDYAYLHKHYPQFVTLNTSANARPKEFWWTPNSGEVYKYWYSYTSWWLPQSLFATKNIAATTELFFKASRYNKYTLHINKGLAGSSKKAQMLDKETSMNPVAFSSPALVILGNGTNKAYLGVKGMEPNAAVAQKARDNINQATQLFMKAAPQSGSYANEADYFLKNWQTAFWGSNYPRLLSIKQKYDPQGLFYCHHCVGSEAWSSDGMCRVTPNEGP